MRTLRRTSRFRRDVRRMQCQGKALDKLKSVLKSLARGQDLALSYRDHVLVGQYRGTRECHIEINWLLVYELAETELVLIRTGSHSDLFK